MLEFKQAGISVRVGAREATLWIHHIVVSLPTDPLEENLTRQS
jgi:hypothetical protein